MNELKWSDYDKAFVLEDAGCGCCSEAHTVLISEDLDAHEAWLDAQKRAVEEARLFLKLEDENAIQD